MYAFHGSDNMFIAHTQVPQSHDLLFRFCHVAPQGSAVLAKGTTNRGTVEEINPVTQIDEGRVYLMEWIMDWNDTPSSNKTTQLSVKHIWTMTLTAGLQRLGETWKKKNSSGVLNLAARWMKTGKVASVLYSFNYTRNIERWVKWYFRFFWYMSRHNL